MQTATYIGALLSIFLYSDLVGGRERSLTEDRQRSASTNPVCIVDVEKERALADRGDLSSARNLRGYYWDCAKGDYRSQLKKWGRVASRIGTKDDEKQYMRILANARFEANSSDWESPASCNRGAAASARKAAPHDDLGKIHKRIALDIQCENAGISPNILALAKRAAEVGNAEDAEFYAELLKARRRPRR
jgi:hypothetical protein